MGKKKKKITRLTEEQYNAYVMSLKNDAAVYRPSGDYFVPPQIRKDSEKKDY